MLFKLTQFEKICTIEGEGYYTYILQGVDFPEDTLIIEGTTDDLLVKRFGKECNLGDVIDLRKCKSRREGCRKGIVVEGILDLQKGKPGREE